MKSTLKAALRSTVFMAAAAVYATPSFAQTPFTLSSKDLKANQDVPAKHLFNSFGCTGGNVSPELSWQGAPSNTKSFVVTMHDPDAPTGSGWWHWVAYNIPASATQLKSNAEQQNALPPQAIQAANDFGLPHYSGPCPPKGDGTHHYVVTVHAMDIEKLDIPVNATPAYVGFMTHTHRIAQASFKVNVTR